MEFQKWWVLKSNTFGQKSIYVLKGNHCILGLLEAPICQTLGMILENKVVQKFKLETNVFYKKKGLLD